MVVSDEFIPIHIQVLHLEVLSMRAMHTGQRSKIQGIYS